MKKSVRFGITWMIFPILCSLYSCNKLDNHIKPEDINTVSLLKATKAAEHIVESNIFRSSIANSKESVLELKKIVDARTIMDEGKPSFYIFNYQNGGFSIISSDKRIEPVLAYSHEGRYVHEGQLPYGLMEWLDGQKQVIKGIREGKMFPDGGLAAEHQWELLTDDCLSVPAEITAGQQNRAAAFCPGYEDYPKIATTGPLLTSSWGQGCDYNALCPSASDGPCGFAYTGCVATAMAQIMRYHRFPNRYVWEGMATNSGIGGQTAQLMRDIGDAVDMDYGGDGSGANSRRDTRNAFVNNFGFSSSAQYLDYESTSNYERVKTELTYNRPVFFRGGDKGYILGIIPKYQNGHAWVCDGYQSVQYPTYSMLALHMNWGWNGSNNGWFSFNNFAVSGLSFNYRSGIVVGIKP